MYDTGEEIVLYNVLPYGVSPTPRIILFLASLSLSLPDDLMMICCSVVHDACRLTRDFFPLLAQKSKSRG
jgi:hypothetical protein